MTSEGWRGGEVVVLGREVGDDGAQDAREQNDEAAQDGAERVLVGGGGGGHGGLCGWWYREEFRRIEEFCQGVFCLNS